MKRNSTKEAEEMKVIGIGDNVCDKCIHLKTMFPGGQALNFAAYAGMLYFLALLAASVLLRHGQMPELTRMLPVLACCAAGGMIGGILS